MVYLTTLLLACTASALVIQPRMENDDQSSRALLSKSPSLESPEAPQLQVQQLQRGAPLVFTTSESRSALASYGEDEVLGKEAKKLNYNMKIQTKGMLLSDADQIIHIDGIASPYNNVHRCFEALQKGNKNWNAIMSINIIEYAINDHEGVECLASTKALSAQRFTMAKQPQAKESRSWFYEKVENASSSKKACNGCRCAGSNSSGGQDKCSIQR